MGMRDDIQGDLAEAMDDADGLADVVEAFEARREVAGEYDPQTGTSTTIETWPGRWIRAKWSRRELDSPHIESTDLKRILLQNETAWFPAVGDTVDGYKVLDFQQDGARATLTIQLRKT